MVKIFSVFFQLFLVVAVAFLIVFFLPEEPLRTLSGIAARQQDEDAATGAAAAAAVAAVTAGSSQPAPGESILSDGVRSNGFRPDGVPATGAPPRVPSAD